ncbi:MAG: hypothetical protein IPM82_24645 [Saprospiraceae bacterium]|nr:hypothetical protein [Saprospiraceae bacterium]
MQELRAINTAKTDLRQLGAEFRYGDARIGEAGISNFSQYPYFGENHF